MALKEYKPGTAFNGVDWTYIRCLQPGLARTVAGERRCTECPVHRAGRYRLRPSGMLWQPHRNAEHRPAGEGWLVVQQHAYHGAVFAERAPAF